jgi:hypothetical protein
LYAEIREAWKLLLRHLPEPSRSQFERELKAEERGGNSGVRSPSDAGVNIGERRTDGADALFITFYSSSLFSTKKIKSIVSLRQSGFC